MGLFETAGSISAAEKIGWLGLVGGGILACGKVIKWIYTFQSEHDKFKEHLIEAEQLIPRFLAMEEASKIAQQERHEMLEEIRGLRQDANAFSTVVLKLLAKQDG